MILDGAASHSASTAESLLLSRPHLPPRRNFGKLLFHSLARGLESHMATPILSATQLRYAVKNVYKQVRQHLDEVYKTVMKVPLLF
jgi:hypothetical protein